MATHPTDEELVLLCLAQSEVPGAPETRAHLEAGCPKCDRKVRELREVLASMAAPALREVPELMLRKALDWLSEQERTPAWGAATEAVRSSGPDNGTRRSISEAACGMVGAAARLLEEIQAALVLDSHVGKILPGIRGGGTLGPRQLLFESSVGSIHLLVEPTDDGASTVQGQFIPSGEGAPAPGSRAVIDTGGHGAAVPLSISGEFRFDRVPPGTIRLSLNWGAHRIIMDPFKP